MTVIADTHVHLYPFYDPNALINGAFHRLARLAPSADFLALCLTERSDCHAFRELPGDRVEDDAMRLGGGWIFSGRQIVTRERIEVLALTTDVDTPDGLELGDTLLRVRNAGGIPVLGWAPGKWFFKRGKLLRALIETASAGEIALGDTSLRPTLWPEPALMRLGRKRGLKVLAGSDPLPFPGEEKYAGTYAISAQAAFNPARPVTSLRAILRDPDVAVELVGTRGGPLDVARRLKKNSECRNR